MHFIHRLFFILFSLIFVVAVSEGRPLQKFKAPVQNQGLRALDETGEPQAFNGLQIPRGKQEAKKDKILFIENMKGQYKGASESYFGRFEKIKKADRPVFDKAKAKAFTIDTPISSAQKKDLKGVAIIFKGRINGVREDVVIRFQRKDVTSAWKVTKEIVSANTITNIKGPTVTFSLSKDKSKVKVKVPRESLGNLTDIQSVHQNTGRQYDQKPLNGTFDKVKKEWVGFSFEPTRPVLRVIGK